MPTCRAEREKDNPGRGGHILSPAGAFRICGRLSRHYSGVDCFREGHLGYGGVFSAIIAGGSVTCWRFVGIVVRNMNRMNAPASEGV